MSDNEQNLGFCNIKSGSMIEAASPGIYVAEIAGIGNIPIVGVETGVAGFLGQTEKGPVEPQLVTNYQEYENIYGSTAQAQSYLPYAVKGFFENGGRKLYIARVVAKQSKTLGTRLRGTLEIRTGSLGLVLSDYLGNQDTNIGPVTGLYALGLIDEISLLYSPDAESISGLNQAMIDQCQSLRDRMVIMESTLGEIDPEPLNQYDSMFAAYYTPWIQDESLSESLEWVSMETWSTTLQRRIQTSVENFLNVEWQKGALVGDTSEKAYFVKVEKTTMLQEAVYKPIIFIESGVALIRPAEFNIIKVGIALE